MTNEIKEILTSMHYAGHTFASYRMKSVDILTLLDYITNLQEENERKERLITQYAEGMCAYANRIDKAVEYINKFESIKAYYEYEECGYTEYNYDEDFKQDLLNILRGDE